MLYAKPSIESTGRIKATPKETGFCPLCNDKLIAKCGRVMTWHWSHKNINNCDSWSKSEGEWHLYWKSLVHPSQCEVVIEHDGEKHRADIFRNNQTIELQNSPIDITTIENRDKFYKNLIWLFNVNDIAKNISFHRLGCWFEKTPENIYEFKWTRARVSFLSSSNHIFFDLGKKDNDVPNRIVYIINTDKVNSGICCFVSFEEFVAFLQDNQEEALPKTVRQAIAEYNRFLENKKIAAEKKKNDDKKRIENYRRSENHRRFEYNLQPLEDCDLPKEIPPHKGPLTEKQRRFLDAEMWACSNWREPYDATFNEGNIRRFFKKWRAILRIGEFLNIPQEWPQSKKEKELDPEENFQLEPD